MSQFGNIFNNIASAKALSNHTPRLPVGRHKVALKRFQPKNSEQGMGPILESDFVIVESTSPTCKSGDVRGWPWFIGQTGWGGTYEQARAKDFLEKAASCIGDTRPVEQFGDDLAGASQPGTGLVLMVEISLQYDRDGKPKKDKKGRDCFNAEWSSIEQTIEQLQASAASIKSMPAVAAQPLPAMNTFATQQVPVASPPVGFGGVQGAAPGFGQAAPQPTQAQPQGAAPGFGGGLSAFQRR